MAVKLTKRAIHKPLVDRVAGALDEENFGLNKAVASEDFFEVLAAKQQKREAVYKGK